MNNFRLKEIHTQRTDTSGLVLKTTSSVQLRDALSEGVVGSLEELEVIRIRSLDFAMRDINVIATCAIPLKPNGIDLIIPALWYLGLKGADEKTPKVVWDLLESLKAVDGFQIQQYLTLKERRDGDVDVKAKVLVMPDKVVEQRLIPLSHYRGRADSGWATSKKDWSDLVDREPFVESSSSELLVRLLYSCVSCGRQR